MKKIIAILVIFATIYSLTSVFQDDSEASGKSYRTSGYSSSYNSGYSYNNTNKYSYCNYCNGLGRVSCDICHSLGYIVIDVPNYGGSTNHSDHKADCSRCDNGRMDCPYC